jgi:chromate reductase, NAD(P)H dehydrogenase (quinone)
MTRDREMIVCGIAGSLRRGSFNRALLRAASEVAPPGMEIRIFERLGDVPAYNADVEAVGDPEPVAALKQAIGGADGLLIATPEYNYSVPGVLKNAIDWASRPPAATVLKGKPTAIVGASGGVTGTARAQLALRQSLVFTQSPVIPAPEVLIARAADKFDAEGRLTDEATRKYLAQHLVSFAAWIRRFVASSV